MEPLGGLGLLLKDWRDVGPEVEMGMTQYLTRGLQDVSRGTRLYYADREGIVRCAFQESKVVQAPRGGGGAGGAWVDGERGL